MKDFCIKYKIDSLDKIVGHKKIVSEFKKRSIDLIFPQVMFFIGEPGGGKTSSANIVSKLINCHNPVVTKDGHKEPCNTCPSCIDVNNEKFSRDILLVNASKIGKEEVNTKLEDFVSNFPMYDKNKILIIDEAHLLSGQGKEATKKLLEKERKNVHFILCTSDKNLISDSAIKRRGQVYLYKPIEIGEIVEFLAHVLKNENLFETIDETFITKGLFTIAQNCNGSPGLALSYLERCIMSELYSEDDIIKELGIVSEEVSTNILEKILNKDKQVFKDLKNNNNMDMKEFFYKSYKILRDAYIYGLTGYAEEEWKEAGAKRLSKNMENLYKLIQTFNSVKSEPYFNEGSLYSELFNYFGNTNSNKIEEEPKVVRRPVIR